MVFALGCEPKAVVPRSRVGDSAAGNACSRKALTGTTRVTRKLDFFGLRGNIRAFKVLTRRNCGNREGSQSACTFHVFFGANICADPELLNPIPTRTASQ